LAVKQWNVGDVLTASDMNAWAVPLAGVKSADQTIISNATLINDADMRFAMSASSIFEFHCYVRFSSGTGQDLKVSFSVPAGADARFNAIRKDLTGTFAGDGDWNAASSVTAQGAGVGSANARTMILTGVAFTAGTAGNLIFQWAQNTSGAFNTTLYQYSYITGRRVG